MSTSDRELLELAARATGIKHSGSKVGDGLWVGHANIFEGRLGRPRWNPLTDDGDALRLAVKLRLEIYFFDGFGEVVAEHNTATYEPGREQYADDMNAATRRAIVRAAAEIGRSMP